MIKKSRPFSNGMEYEFFKECWCENCRHYKVRENDGFPEFPENGGCRILDCMENARFDERFWPNKKIVEEWEGGKVKRWHKCLDFERRDDNVGAQPETPVFGQWIPASNPPENCEDVIVCVSGRRGNIIYDHGVEASDCCYEDSVWYVCGVEVDNLTIHAWMPLPEPPKKGEENR